MTKTNCSFCCFAMFTTIKEMTLRAQDVRNWWNSTITFDLVYLLSALTSLDLPWDWNHVIILSVTLSFRGHEVVMALISFCTASAQLPPPLGTKVVLLNFTVFGILLYQLPCVLRYHVSLSLKLLFFNIILF
jgi:hypothetical protein